MTAATSTNETHAYSPGDVVTVHNTTLSGRAIVEGQATIVRRLDVENQYEVRFHSEPTETYDRFVNP